MIVKIIPKIKLPLGANSVFDYETTDNNIRVGQIVEVEFRRKVVEAMVLEIQKQRNKEMEGRHKFILKPILRILDEKPVLFPKQMEAMKWMAEYYFNPLSNVFKMLVPDIPKTKNQKPKINIKNVKTSVEYGNLKLAVLKSRLVEVKRVIDEIVESEKNIIFQWDDIKEKILVYIKLIEDCLAKNQQVLILLPQIADVEFLLGFLGLKFGAKSAILHGQMPKTAQYGSWARIRENKAKIVLGTRSAVLVPFRDLGLAIIDEEESADHKNYDMNPRYDARRIAEELGAKVVYSSSALRVETYEKLEIRNLSTSLKTGKKLGNELSLVKLLSLKKNVELVDMANELTRGEYSPISTRLEEEMRLILEQGKKVILFLNRKGMATMVVCRDCKFLFKCQKCDLPLTYDENIKQLICHHCGFRQPTPLSCPKCQGISIKFVGTGTQRIEREVRKLFLDKKIIRIDKDVNYYKLDIEKYDVVIATQLLLKDYKIIDNVGLFGIISLDSTLSRPDFRASERLYQLVAKILSFARFNKIDKFLWQTFLIDNEIVSLAARQDYEGFYKRELQARKDFNYPPFCKLVKLIYKSPDFKKAKFEAGRLVKNLMSLKLDGARIIGPIKPLVNNVRGNFIEVVVLKLTNLDEVKKIPLDVLRGFLVDVEPESVD